MWKFSLKGKKGTMWSGLNYSIKFVSWDQAGTKALEGQGLNCSCGVAKAFLNF